MYIGNDLSRGKSTIYHFDASGGESSITTATRPNVAISYTVGWVAVYLNGVRLHDTDFTATTGNSITALSPTLVSGDVVIIEAAHVFSVANTVPATGGTFTGSVIDSEMATFSKIIQNPGTISGSITIASGYNAMAIGPTNFTGTVAVNGNLSIV